MFIFLYKFCPKYISPYYTISDFLPTLEERLTDLWVSRYLLLYFKIKTGIPQYNSVKIPNIKRKKNPFQLSTNFHRKPCQEL